MDKGKPILAAECESKEWVRWCHHTDADFDPICHQMFPLQSLPKLATRKEGKKASERPEAKANGRTGDVGDPQAAKENLAVLEQQLALVRKYAVRIHARTHGEKSMVPSHTSLSLPFYSRYQASAAQARKFQDAQSLKDSAQELEAEIAQVRKTVTAL